MVTGAVPLEAAVTRPFALTVTLAFVNEPTFEFTVARVPVAITSCEPLNAGLVYERSPLIAIVRAVARVAALPVVFWFSVGTSDAEMGDITTLEPLPLRY